MYQVEAAGFEGQKIEVQPAGLFSVYKLFVNGEEAQRGKNKVQMILHKNDGTEVIATWQASLWGLDVPTLLIDGQTVHIVEPFKWHEVMWIGLPVLLVFVGGAVGGIAGFTAFAANKKLFRGEFNTIVKYALTGIVSALGIFAYFVVAAMIAG